MTTVSKPLALLVGAILLLPTGAFAQGATTSSDGSASADATTVADSPSGTSANNPGETRRPRRESGISPRTPHATPADAKPLSQKMRDQIQNREKQRDCAGSASGTDCMSGRGIDRRNEMRAHAMERRGEILKRISQLMIGRMDAAIERLSKIADRIDSRILKLKEKGVDTTKPETLVGIARGKISDAKIAVGVAANAVASAVVQADASASSTKPIDAGKPVREALNKAREGVFAAHKALVEAVKSLIASTALRENTSQRPGMLRTSQTPAHDTPTTTPDTTQ